MTTLVFYNYPTTVLQLPTSHIYGSYTTVAPFDSPMQNSITYILSLFHNCCFDYVGHIRPSKNYSYYECIITVYCALPSRVSIFFYT